MVKKKSIKFDLHVCNMTAQTLSGMLLFEYNLQM